MANTYTYSGHATRWSEGDPTAVDFLNVSRVNSDHLYEALNTILVTSGVTSGATSTLVSNTETNTQSPGNNTTRLATTAFVTAAVTAGSTAAAGDTGEIQYNDTDAFAASSSFTFGSNALMVKGAAGSGTASAGLLNLWTAETTVVDTDQLGRIDFKAPSQTGSGDGVLVAASIYAEADATFSSTVNETDIVFATAHDGAATEKFRITSQGEIGLSGANYGTDGYVLTSTGAGTAVAWEAIAAATGVDDIKGYVDGGALKWEVESGTKWTFGWWESSDGRWWLLGNTESADSTFTRAEAEFYIPTGDIADVPSS